MRQRSPLVEGDPVAVVHGQRVDGSLTSVNVAFSRRLTGVPAGGGRSTRLSAFQLKGASLKGRQDAEAAQGLSPEPSPMTMFSPVM